MAVLVAVNKFADNLSDSALATAIAAWLSTLSISTYHNLEIEHVSGFWVCIFIYE